MRRDRAAITAIFAALFGAACGPSAETLEARRVLRAIDVLRDAPMEPLSAREALVADLEREEAKGAVAVRARDACVKAYRLLLEGKALQVRVEQQLKPGAAGSAGAAGLNTLRDLVAAEAKIKESSEVMPACNNATAELRIGPASGR